MVMEPSRPRRHSPDSSLRLWQVVWHHPLLCYFLVAFGFTWTYEVIAFAVLHLPLLPWGILLAVGPTGGAFLMTSITEGRAGVLHLLRRYVSWRVGVQWYLFALLGVPTITLLGFLVLPGSLAALRAPTPELVMAYAAAYVAIFLLGGPLFEEPGWRGFALPRLQGRAGPLLGSMTLGVLWGFWHLPLFLLVPGYDGAGNGFSGISIPFVEFLLSIVAVTCIITWVFNNAHGSILLPMLLHASLNTANGYVPVTPPGMLSQALCFVAVAVIIIAATRGRLSYQRHQRDRRETTVSGPAHDRHGTSPPHRPAAT